MWLQLNSMIEDGEVGTAVLVNLDHVYLIEGAGDQPGAFLFMTDYDVSDGGLHVSQRIEEIKHMIIAGGVVCGE